MSEPPNIDEDEAIAKVEDENDPIVAEEEEEVEPAFEMREEDERKELATKRIQEETTS